MPASRKRKGAGPDKHQQKLSIMRQGLKEQERLILEQKDDIANPSNDIADILLQKQNELLDNSKKALKNNGGREVLRDANLFRSLSHHTVQQVENLGANFKKVNASKFLTALRDRQQSEDGVSWTQLGKEVGVFFKGVPRGTFLCGPLRIDLEAKERKQHFRAVREVFVEEKPMEVGTTAAPAEENIHSVARETIKNTLLDLTAKNETLKDGTKKQQSIDAVEFLSDPNSFANTVSNIFDFSMLIKDGNASVTIDEKTGLPRVKAERMGVPNAVPNQAVVAFTLKDYKELMKAYDLKEPCFTIPDRAPN